MSEKVNFAEALGATTKKSIAPRNRVVLLLEELYKIDRDNFIMVREALEDMSVSNAAITRTIKNIWGDDTITNTSVRDFRVQKGII